MMIDRETWVLMFPYLAEHDMCIRCGGPKVAHGMVHVRTGNGGGHNVRCPESDSRVDP
jgi:hypothetical protein